MTQNNNRFFQAIEGINKMCDLIAKHGIWKLLVSMLMCSLILLSLYIVFNPEKIIEKISDVKIEIDRKRHADLLQYRMEIEPKIDKLLQVTMDSLDASRIFILEPHNGTSTLNGIPFWYLNMSFERCESGVSDVKRLYKDIEANDFPLAYQVYINHEWTGNISELAKIDPKLNKFMTINDAVYMDVVAMMGTETFLGFVGITYTHLEDVPCEAKRKRVLHSTAQKITVYLDGYDKRKSR